MKTLIIYYSYGGNTRSVAKMIQEKTGADMEEIQTVSPYTGSYNSVVDQGQREVNSGFMPKIKEMKVDISDYDRIILGTPVWWYTFAPAMKTFLSGTDLSRKVVYPFATNGGWLGHTLKDIKAACKGADVREGLGIQFDGNVMKESSKKELKAWIETITN